MEEKEERREGADQETVLTIEESFAELENILEQLESSESSL